MKGKLLKSIGMLMSLTFLAAIPGMSWAKEESQKWELVNPAGVIIADPIKFVARPTSLEGKTVVLRWNAKPNGDVLLNRVAELLVQNVKGVKVIKAWEVAPETQKISYGYDTSRSIAKKLASFKPDLVIGAPAD